MRSAVFLGQRNLKVLEREIPKPGPKEVLIKVTSGYCTDEGSRRLRVRCTYL